MSNVHEMEGWDPDRLDAALAAMWAGDATLLRQLEFEDDPDRPSISTLLASIGEDCDSLHTRKPRIEGG